MIGLSRCNKCECGAKVVQFQLYFKDKLQFKNVAKQRFRLRSFAAQHRKLKWRRNLAAGRIFCTSSTEQEDLIAQLEKEFEEVKRGAKSSKKRNTYQKKTQNLEANQDVFVLQEFENNFQSVQNEAKRKNPKGNLSRKNGSNNMNKNGNSFKKPSSKNSDANDSYTNNIKNGNGNIVCLNNNKNVTSNINGNGYYNNVETSDGTTSSMNIETKNGTFQNGQNSNDVNQPSQKFKDDRYQKQNYFNKSNQQKQQIDIDQNEPSKIFEEGWETEEEEYFDEEGGSSPFPLVTERTKIFEVVNSKQAKLVMNQIRQLVEQSENSDDLVFACDTEVSEIDIKQESPVVSGELICFSVYAGPGINFGGKKQENQQQQLKKKTKSRQISKAELWVDVLGFLDQKKFLEENQGKKLTKRQLKLNDKAEILLCFKEFFEDKKYKKVWQNYGFDRHVIERSYRQLLKLQDQLLKLQYEEQIQKQEEFVMHGFAGDTMHMARLFDTSRKIYGLAALTADDKIMFPGQSYEQQKNQNHTYKIPMTQIFGYFPLRADGEPSKILKMPSEKTMQLDNDDEVRHLICEQKGYENKADVLRKKWVEYSAKDAKVTWHLYKALQYHLKQQSSDMDSKLKDVCLKQDQQDNYTLWNLYQDQIIDFGELLSGMEAEGIRVDREHLKQQLVIAQKDQKTLHERFLKWIKNIIPDAAHMNPNSGPQITQLIFGGLNTEIQDGNFEISVSVEKEREFNAINPEYEKWVENGKVGKAPLKNIKLYLHNIWSSREDGCYVPPPPGIFPEQITETGLPQVNGKTLSKFSGNEEAALEALQALDPFNHLLFDNDGKREEKSVSLEEQKEQLKRDLLDFQIQLFLSENTNKSKFEIMRDFQEKNNLGLIFSLMGDLQEGLNACIAIDHLINRRDEEREQEFKKWLKKYVECADSVKLSSSAQVKVLLFGGFNEIPSEVFLKNDKIHNIWSSKDSNCCPKDLNSVIQKDLGGVAKTDLSTLRKMCGDVSYAEYLLKILNELDEDKIFVFPDEINQFDIKKNQIFTSLNQNFSQSQVRNQFQLEYQLSNFNEKLNQASNFDFKFARVFENSNLYDFSIQEPPQKSILSSNFHEPWTQNQRDVSRQVITLQKLRQHKNPDKYQFLRELAYTNNGQIRYGIEPKLLLEIGEQFGFGKLFAHMGSVIAGLEACVSVGALVKISTIDKLIGAFLTPLQSDSISTERPMGDQTSYRIHASLNLRTETGRLSCRQPNLQNQPALEKDKYQIRKAFCASNGNCLVVADYGQLELRVLAHITDCTSMLKAFEEGGDFHSRTAADMYDHIKEEIQSGKVLLEKGDWKGGADEEMPPLVKNKYASERRKAKVLNFSIAYGKTAFGLSKDWGTSKEEAQATLDKWYASREQVKQWQEQRHNQGFEHGYVSTMFGRRRHLPYMKGMSAAVKGIGGDMRKSINTPIQGSAADIVMAAMIRIVKNEELKKMGYKLLLQIHDEVILEGPEEYAEAAKQLVVECMEKPFFDVNKEEYVNPMRCELKVDANVAKTWYEGK